MSTAAISTEQRISRYSALGELVRETLTEGWFKAEQWFVRRMPFHERWGWGYSTSRTVSSGMALGNASTNAHSFRGEKSASIDDILRSGSIFASWYSVVMVIMVGSASMTSYGTADFPLIFYL